MRLIAILCWYDEPPELLEEAVGSLATAGVDHLVAVDGAYELYSDGSGVTDPDDWYLVADADNVVSRCEPGLKGLLSATDKLVACYGLTQQPRTVASLTPAQRAVVVAHADHWWGTVDAPQTMPTRMLYRAVRGLRYGPQHWCVSAGADRLWGPEPQAPAEDLSGLLEVEHRWADRGDERLLRDVRYYERRDEAQVEGASEAEERTRALAANVARYLNERPV